MVGEQGVRGSGGRSPGEKEAGGIWETGVEEAKLRKIARHFAIENLQRDGSSQKIEGGNRD